MTQNQYDRLSPEEFKAIVHGKGWTFKGLAAHWEKTPVWISNLSRDPCRPKHYDDAVMGLPAKNYLSRSLKSRKRIAHAYLFEHQAKQKVSSRAFRYHAHLGVGTIISVMEDVGSMAEAGARGCVFQVLPIRTGGEEYGIIFENGSFDWFTPDYIDRCIVLTGLEDTTASEYKYSSEEALVIDYKKRAFNFHP